MLHPFRCRRERLNRRDRNEEIKKAIDARVAAIEVVAKESSVASSQMLASAGIIRGLARDIGGQNRARV